MTPSCPSRGSAGLLSRRYGDRIAGSFTVPGREGAYAPIPDDVPHALRSALHSRGVERLYTHQADAWHAAQRGEHVANATPTASGKPLCYTLPAVAAAMCGRAKAPATKARFLYRQRVVAGHRASVSVDFVGRRKIKQ